jgi:hypothetical protein
VLQTKRLHIILGLSISLALLLCAFYKIQWLELWEALQQAAKTNVLLCMFFFGLSCACRALIWRMTTGCFKRIRFYDLFSGIVVGYMGNNLFPLRVGELLRTYYLCTRTGLTATSVFSTICIERVLDLFSLTLILLVSIAFGVRGLLANALTIALVILIVITVLTTLLLTAYLKIKIKQNEAPGLRGVIINKIKEFLEAFTLLRQPTTVLLIVFLSLLAWACNYAAVLVIIWHTSINILEASLLVLLFVNLGMLIPSSPGALGVMQVAFWMALTPFGFTKEQAIALSFAYQGGLYLFTFALGIPFYVQFQMRYKVPEKTKLQKKGRDGYLAGVPIEKAYDHSRQ